MPDDSILRSELGELGRGERITSVQRLSGGFAGDPWLVSYADGTRVVGKTLAGAPRDLFRAETEGLAALRATGYVRTPEVLAVTGRLLLLEELPAREDTETSWAAFAADLAGLHLHTVGNRFGWDHDSYLGRLPQINTRSADGHEFFAQNRLLRYLGEPLTEQALTRADRRALERFCARMPEIIPAMPPVLTHATCGQRTCSERPAAGWPSSTRPSPAPGPKWTCRCCGVPRAPRQPIASSTFTRN